MAHEDRKLDEKVCEASEEGSANKPAKQSNVKWEDMFNRLAAYKEKHGDCLVPNRYPEDTQLGSWVSAQRRQYKIMIGNSNESTPMTEERARRLEDLGFQWNTKDPRHVPWESRYQELVAFRKKYGHSQVPIGWTENVKLSNWVSTQRQEYKLMQRGRQSRLTKDRVEKLDKIDFVWEAQRGGPRRKRRATQAVPPCAKPVEVATHRNDPSLMRPTWPGWPNSWTMGVQLDGSESQGDVQKPVGFVPWQMMPGGMYQQNNKAGAFAPMAAPWTAGLVPNGYVMPTQPPEAAANDESKPSDLPDASNVATMTSIETADDEVKGDVRMQDSVHSLLGASHSTGDDSTDLLDSKPESIDTKESSLE